MSRSKITIFNMAVARSGQSKQLVEGDTSPEFAILERNYDEIVGEAFEAGNFHFGRTEATLTNRTAGSFGFDDKYLLPNDVLHVQKVMISGYNTTLDWEVNGKYLHINYNDGNPVVVYYRKGAESSWSHTFTNAVIDTLTGLLRKAINEEYEEGENDRQSGFFGLQVADSRASKEHKARRPFKESRTMRSRRYGQQRFHTRGTS